MPAKAKPQSMVGIWHHDPGPGVRILWRPHEGPQTFALLRDEYEIFFGGAKGGGKTEAGMAWLIKGNDTYNSKWMSGHPADVTYINHPNYRALSLRKNAADMGDWIERAKRIYRPMGADFANDEFTFPSGAKIVLGHLAQEDAYEKYQGQEFHRILIEELTQIPSEKLYDRVRSCLRSTHSMIHPQMFLTANPGGRGHRWVKDRFVMPTDVNGNRIKPLTRIRQKVRHPLTGEKEEITRIFIPAKVTDNPTLMQDKMYLLNLATMDEQEREYYLHGNWDFNPGAYFAMFRDKRRPSEPENAVHVIDDCELKPWWPRWIGGDWGYKHCSTFYWACQHPNGQVHIYRELVVSGLGSVQLGTELARLSMKDLDGLESHSMPLELSPDAFAKEDEINSNAEGIMLGIQQVLGPQAAFLVENDQQYLESLSRQQKASIAIRRAHNQRVLGWQYIRELMRWEKLKLSVPEYDQDYAMRLFQEDTKKYLEYVRSLQRAKQEVLPKLQIHRQACPRLIQAIPTAVYNSEGKLGLSTEDVLKSDTWEDDVLDGFRYTLARHRFQALPEPFQETFDRRMREVEERHPEGMDGMMRVMVARKIEEDHDRSKASMGAMILPRQSSRRYRFERTQ